MEKRSWRSLKRFPIRSVESTPKFDPLKWRLKVDGLVNNPISLSLDDLLSFPKKEIIADFVCVEGWGVEKQIWVGVTIKSIGLKAKIKDEAKFVTFYASGDIYKDSLTLEEAFLDETILAYQLNGKLLSPKQGKPLRLIVPSMYAYKNVKWVERVEFKKSQDIGYWEERGYPIDAYVR